MSHGRIINGYLKRRIIEMPKVPTTRPTSDKLKGSIFNVLLHRYMVNFEECLVLDIFAGSGAFGIESISLGCQKAIFVESNKVATKCIENNLKNLNVEDKAMVLKNKIEHITNKIFEELADTYDNILVFMDPPYAETKLLENQISRFKDILKNKSKIFIIETDKNLALNETHKLNQKETKIYFCAC